MCNEPVPDGRIFWNSGVRTAIALCSAFWLVSLGGAEASSDSDKTRPRQHRRILARKLAHASEYAAGAPEFPLAGTVEIAERRNVGAFPAVPAAAIAPSQSAPT